MWTCASTYVRIYFGFSKLFSLNADRNAEKFLLLLLRLLLSNGIPTQNDYKLTENITITLKFLICIDLLKHLV